MQKLYHSCWRICQECKDNFLIDLFSANWGHINCNLQELFQWLIFKFTLFLLLWPALPIFDRDLYITGIFKGFLWFFHWWDYIFCIGMVFQKMSVHGSSLTVRMTDRHTKGVQQLACTRSWPVEATARKRKGRDRLWDTLSYQPKEWRAQCSSFSAYFSE